MTDVGPWSRVLVHHVADTFRDADKISREWRDLNFTAAPDLTRAHQQCEQFISVLAATGPMVQAITVDPLERHHLTLDAIYIRDASVMTPRGAILCRMGKHQRASEPDALGAAYEAAGIPVVGRIEAPGVLEGGDVAWLGPRLMAVGRGYRTNDAGIKQLRALLADDVDELIVVALPHYRGPSDVFHLMSILSPVDVDLAVVYSPLMPVVFRERLLDLGYRLVEVPDDEFESMGANVFAGAPGRCVMVDGNPRTRAALERAGASVFVYDGSEVSLKGGGGPTCLTRPVPVLKRG